MRKLIGFDNQMYLDTQSARIRERISQFGGKLYLEFGGLLHPLPGDGCLSECGAVLFPCICR